MKTELEKTNERVLELEKQVKKLTSNTVLAEVPERKFEWVCNECNFANLTDSVPQDEIDAELHACINCGCFEMHKRHFR